MQISSALKPTLQCWPNFTHCRVRVRARLLINVFSQSSEYCALADGGVRVGLCVRVSCFHECLLWSWGRKTHAISLIRHKHIYGLLWILKRGKKSSLTEPQTQIGVVRTRLIVWQERFVNSLCCQMLREFVSLHTEFAGSTNQTDSVKFVSPINSQQLVSLGWSVEGRGNRCFFPKECLLLLICTLYKRL